LPTAVRDAQKEPASFQNNEYLYALSA